MASLLNNASLLLNPAGSIIAYEEDKILSVLPRNGAGDFTFSGGDGGTRVNQQGYIEVTPANLASDSNSFTNNSDFTKTGSLSGPFSSTDGNILTPTGTGEKYSQIASLTVPANTVFTFSVYAKYLQNTQLALRCVYSNGAQDQSTIFNLQTNTVVALPGTHSNPQIISVGGGWFRYSVDINSTTPPAFPFLFRVNAANNGSLGFTPASGDGFYISSAQINTGGLKPYQPTTDRLNYPRITYQNGRGALLSEPQRTNVTTNSETMGASTGTTVSLNSGISPDGTQNADKIIEDTSNGTHITGFGGSLGGSVDSSTFCVSIFAKAAERTRFIIFDNNQGAGAAINVFDLGNGTKISGNGTIENYGNGWYRCIIFPSKTDNTTANIQIRLINTGTNDSYTGDGSSGIFFWGKQIEAGSFPTSYIPTTSATVTRPIDITLNTNASSVIGQTEGVLYADVMWNPLKSVVDHIITEAYGASTANQIFIENFANNFYFGIDSAGSRVVQIGPAFTNTTGRFKLAAAYKNNDFAFYVNGQQIGTDNAGSVPTCSNLRVGSYDGNIYSYSDKINTVALFNTRLTNTQLADLTTVRSGSGGNISYYGPYTIHTFTGSATFTPSFNGQVEVLVVAGGGGGGSGFNRSACGGGGGAGGLLYASSYGVSAGTGITVTIGAGGAGGPAGTGSPTGDGSNGSNSVFGGLTSIGGGGGTTYFDTNGKNGGSGGGAGGAGGYTPVGGQGIPGQGNNGGNQVGSGQSTDTTSCGGGGGAGAVGANGVTSQRGGNGGIGLPYYISGFSTYYAGGGGGGASQVGGGFGGLGGGANGGNLDSNGSSGVNYTGGGGGGASSGVGVAATAGGTGGSGIVIVRYLT
jgi:hypothetical protein